jgi:hypothetical protein
MLPFTASTTPSGGFYGAAVQDFVEVVNEPMCQFLERAKPLPAQLVDPTSVSDQGPFIAISPEAVEAIYESRLSLKRYALKSLRFSANIALGCCRFEFVKSIHGQQQPALAFHQPAHTYPFAKNWARLTHRQRRWRVA